MTDELHLPTTPREALADMFDLLDEGFLVRNTTRDDEPDWWIRQLSFVRRLAACAVALKANEPPATQQCGKDERTAQIDAALAIIRQNYDCESRSSTWPREYVENAVMQLIDAGYVQPAPDEREQSAAAVHDWIKHDGGPMPVAPETMIRIRERDRFTSTWTVSASYAPWNRRDIEYLILATPEAAP